MSTIGYGDWAVDLATVGAIYPFQGYEGLMVLLGAGFWILWHVDQLRAEQDEIDYEVGHEERDENIQTSLERY